jgi:hypothetical protein
MRRRSVEAHSTPSNPLRRELQRRLFSEDSELEDEDAALGVFLGSLARRLVQVLRQLQARLFELVLTTLFLLPPADLLDDEGRKHGRSLAFGPVMGRLK